MMPWCLFDGLPIMKKGTNIKNKTKQNPQNPT